MKAFGLAWLMLLAWVADASARCSVPRFQFLGNQTVDAYMTVSTGDRCPIRLRTSSGPNHRTEIVQRPSNGSVVTEAPHRVVYRSGAGYVGSDTFTFAWRGLSASNSPTVRTVRVNVSVTAR
jgi:hypothetical protein